MAGFRQIHTQIWADEWFAELATDEKMLFIYLFSNDATSLTGLYKLSLRIMEFESGINRERILEIFEKFAQDGKAYYENGIVLVTNMQKYHNSISPKVTIRMNKDIEAIPDCRLKRLYLYGIDTVPLNKDKDKDENKDQDEGLKSVSFSPTFRDAERLYCEVTKFATVPGSVVPALDGLLSMLQDYGWDATLARCQSAFKEWTSRKRKDNQRNYSPTHTKWIEWAISGETDAKTESDVDRAIREIQEQSKRLNQ